MQQRLIILGLMLVLLLIPAGCWNAREIDELAFVMGIALDDAGNGRIKVTVQIAKPSTYSKSPTGGGTESEKPYWIATATGKTIFEAIRDLATFSSRRIFWSHNKIILIGEKMARRDIAEILDFFSRNPELRLRTWIAVVPADAGKMLTKGPGMEEVLAASLEKVTAQRVWPGKGYGIMLKDFLEDYLSPATYPVAAKITVTAGPAGLTTRLAGAAIFGADKMTGWLDEQETRGLLWLKDKMHSAVMVVPCPLDERPLSIEITGGHIDYQSEIKKQQPQLTIMAKASGNLSEQACTTDFNRPENLRQLEKALTAAVTEDIRVATRVAQQELGLDFPGFNQVFHYQHNQEWHRMLMDRWPRLFKEMPVTIMVEAKIPRIALFAKSLKSEKKYPARRED